MKTHRNHLTLVTLLLLALLGSPPLRGAPCLSPAGETLINQVTLVSGIASQNNGNGFGFLVSGFDNATGTTTYTINRPGFSAVTKVFSPDPGFPASNFQMAAGWVGAHALLFLKSERDATGAVQLVATLTDASQQAAPDLVLFAVTQLASSGVSIGPVFHQNSDGSCLFACTRATGGLLDRISSPCMWRTDHFDSTTSALCCAGDQSISPRVSQVTGQIRPTSSPAGQTTDAAIVFDGTIEASCSLPARPNLVANGNNCLNFGSILVGTSLSKPVNFCNPAGQCDITVTSLGSSAPFSAPAFQPFGLAPGHCQSLTVTFAPTTSGSFSINLPIGDNPVAGQTFLCCTGSATNAAPNLVITPTSLNFGSVCVNGTPSLSLNFVNQGSAAVTISAISASVHFLAPNFSSFTLSPAGTSGSSHSVSIQFTAGASLGTFCETLNITRSPTTFGATSIRCCGSTVLPVTVSALTNCIPENAVNGVLAFRVSRGCGTASSLTVNLSTGGSAIPNNVTFPFACGAPDYKALPTSVTIPAGSDHFDIKLSPIADSTAGATTTVLLNVDPGAGYNIGSPSSATVCINDSDPLPVATVYGKTTTNCCQPMLGVGISLSAPSKAPVTVNWTTGTGFSCATCVSVLGGPLQCISLMRSTATPGASCCSFCNPSPDFISSNGQLVFPPCTVTQMVSVPICGGFPQTNKTFFLVLSSPLNAVLGRHDVCDPGVGVCTIQEGCLCLTVVTQATTGFWDVTPGYGATAAVHEPIHYSYTWTVPDPLNWHILESLVFRVRDEQENILTILFDVGSKTFNVLNEATGQFENGGLAGSPYQLETPEATLHLQDSSVVGSGPTGPSVTLNLALRFKPSAANRPFIVEVAAKDLLGHESAIAQAGTLLVEPIH